VNHVMITVLDLSMTQKHVRPRSAIVVKRSRKMVLARNVSLIGSKMTMSLGNAL